MQNGKKTKKHLYKFHEKMESSQIYPSMFVPKLLSFIIPYHFTSYLQHYK